MSAPLTIAASQAKLDEIVRAGMTLFLAHQREGAGVDIKDFLERANPEGHVGCGLYFIIMGTAWFKGEFAVPGGPLMTVEQAEIAAGVRDADGNVKPEYAGFVPEVHEV